MGKDTAVCRAILGTTGLTVSSRRISSRSLSLSSDLNIVNPRAPMYGIFTYIEYLS